MTSENNLTSKNNLDFYSIELEEKEWQILALAAVKGIEFLVECTCGSNHQIAIDAATEILEKLVDQAILHHSLQKSSNEN